MSLLLVALIFTSIHFVTVIIDFPVNVMEKNTNLPFVSLGISTVEAHINAELKYLFQRTRLHTNSVVGEFERHVCWEL